MSAARTPMLQTGNRELARSAGPGLPLGNRAKAMCRVPRALGPSQPWPGESCGWRRAPGERPSFVLRDAAGRKVMDLAPDTNDLSRLAPGVYFVCGNGAGYTTKVTVVK